MGEKFPAEGGGCRAVGRVVGSGESERSKTTAGSSTVCSEGVEMGSGRGGRGERRGRGAGVRGAPTHRGMMGEDFGAVSDTRRRRFRVAPSPRRAGVRPNRRRPFSARASPISTRPSTERCPGDPLGPRCSWEVLWGQESGALPRAHDLLLASRRNSFETDHKRAQQCFAFYSRAVLRIKVRARVTPKDDE